MYEDGDVGNRENRLLVLGVVSAFGGLNIILVPYHFPNFCAGTLPTCNFLTYHCGIL